MGVRYHVEGSGFRLQGFGFRFTDKSLELRVQATGRQGVMVQYIMEQFWDEEKTSGCQRPQ